MSAKNTLKVLGFGFPRTGTMSLKHALEILDFGPCYHMIEVFRRPMDSEFWVKAWKDYSAHGEMASISWMDVFDGFQSTTDCPGSGFWKKLLADFPDAKVILTQRDPESWYQSFQTTVLQAMTQSEEATDSHREVQLMAKALILDGIFKGRFEDKAFAIEKLKQYSQLIVEAVPKDNLLVMNVADGWQPLCDFLNRPVPDQPFPKSNTRTEFQNRLATGRMTDLSAGDAS